MFTTLSTILVPMTTGLTSSLSLQRDLLIDRLRFPILVTPLCGTRPRDGEHDCCLGFTLETVIADDDFTMLGAVGRALVAEAGLAGTDVLKFEGASTEIPGTSKGFEGLDFTVGEGPREGTVLFELVGRNFDVEEARPLGADTPDALTEVDC